MPDLLLHHHAIRCFGFLVSSSGGKHFESVLSGALFVGLRKSRVILGQKIAEDVLRNPIESAGGIHLCKCFALRLRRQIMELHHSTLFRNMLCANEAEEWFDIVQFL